VLLCVFRWIMFGRLMGMIRVKREAENGMLREGWWFETFVERHDKVIVILKRWCRQTRGCVDDEYVTESDEGGKL